MRHQGTTWPFVGPNRESLPDSIAEIAGVRLGGIDQWSRDEVLGAILVGLPAAGNVVTQVLPTALRAYDGGQDVDPR